jgi:hypothetical protein
MSNLSLFFPRFLAHCALIGAVLQLVKAPSCLTSFADSDPGHLKARASRFRQHNKLLRVLPSLVQDSRCILLRAPRAAGEKTSNKYLRYYSAMEAHEDSPITAAADRSE